MNFCRVPEKMGKKIEISFLGINPCKTGRTDNGSTFDYSALDKNY